MGLLEGIDVTGIAWQFLSVFVVILGVVFCTAIMVGVIWAVQNYKKYNMYRVIIFAKDSFGNIEITPDRAGVFKDITGHNKFFLQKAKVGLDSSKIKWFRNGKHKTVFLVKCSEKAYKVVYPRIADRDLDISVSVEDTNWAKDEYMATKKAFLYDLLEKYAPLVGVIMAILALMMLGIYYLKGMGDISTNLAQTAQICRGGGI